MTEKDCDSCNGHFAPLDQEPCVSCVFTRGYWSNWQPATSATSCAQTVEAKKE
jgi:hypothetical protein